VEFYQLTKEAKSCKSRKWPSRIAEGGIVILKKRYLSTCKPAKGQSIPNLTKPFLNTRIETKKTKGRRKKKKQRPWKTQQNPRALLTLSTRSNHQGGKTACWKASELGWNSRGTRPKGRVNNSIPGVNPTAPNPRTAATRRLRRSKNRDFSQCRRRRESRTARAFRQSRTRAGEQWILRSRAARARG
jgi:hypothetical protein